jgi:hypothetical protein
MFHKITPFRFWTCSASLAPLIAGLFGVAAAAQDAPPGASRKPPFEQVPKGDPSFFVTSRGIDGGNLGGLAGADAHCARLAREAGLPDSLWRAYLSTQSSGRTRPVNARDRIGKGPWFNVERIRIAVDLAHLHGDTRDLARAGNLVSQGSALTERGERIGGKGDPVLRHDILTGSRPDGRAYDNRYDRTCRNWTYAGHEGSAQIGHSDRDTIGLSISWNSAHPTTGCAPSDLKATGGDGLFYCFAVTPTTGNQSARTSAR